MRLFQPELAGVLEHGRAVFLDVVIEPNATVSPGHDIRQRGLAHLERIAAKVIAVQLNQIEGVPVASQGGSFRAARHQGGPFTFKA